MKLLFINAICLFLLFLPSSVSADELNSLDISSIKVEKASLTKTESASRSASVKVSTQTGYGTGIYVRIGKDNVVFTAEHVVDNVQTVSIVTESGITFGNVIFKDQENDFAVIKPVSEISNRDPVKLKVYSKNLKQIIGQEISYSGYPSGHDLLTIRGHIAGVERGCVLIQSYAWMGSSGSGVFNRDGELIGILTAVDLGRFGRDHQLVETIAWVVPVSNINMSRVKIALSLADSM